VTFNQKKIPAVAESRLKIRMICPPADRIVADTRRLARGAPEQVKRTELHQIASARSRTSRAARL